MQVRRLSVDFMGLLALVAQWIEQEPSNLLVAGSIPAEGATFSSENADDSDSRCL